MTEPHQYQVHLTWQEKRKGILNSNVLDHSIEVVTPPEFPNGIPHLWSPEHLFVAAVNGCFMTTFLAIAENSKLNFTKFECNGIGALEKVDGKYCITKITLMPKLTIGHPAEKDKASRVLTMTEKNCLISNSINSQITVFPEVFYADTSADTDSER